VIDVGPTILEAVGIPEPKVVDGIGQEPMDGTSFLFSFDDAATPERHTMQYFEMFGGRGMYKDGWWAASRPDRIPWDFSQATIKQFGPEADWDPDRDVGWELYNLAEDFSQANNIAAQHPDKVKELQDLWWSEAERNRVLPLMAGVSVMYGILPPLPTATRFSFMGDVQNIQRGMTPRIQGRSYAIEGELKVPAGGAEGVIVANADFTGGYSLWVDDKGLLHHAYSLLGVEVYRQVSTEPIPSGDVTVKMLFESDAPKPGSGGKVTLWANDKQIGEGRLDKTVPIAFTSYAGMDMGRDNGGVVDLTYEEKAPYAFTGQVKKVVFDLKPVRAEAEQDLHQHAMIHAVAAGVAG
jgi:arylsulfatase